MLLLSKVLPSGRMLRLRLKSRFGQTAWFLPRSARGCESILCPRRRDNPTRTTPRYGKAQPVLLQNAEEGTRSGQARRPLRPPGPEASHWSRRKPGFGKYLCAEGPLWCCRFSAFGRPWPPGGCSRQPRKLPAAYPARLRRFMMPLAKADQVPVL